MVDLSQIPIAIQQWFWAGANLIAIVLSLVGLVNKFGISVNDLEARGTSIRRALFWRETQIIQSFLNEFLARGASIVSETKEEPSVAKQEFVNVLQVPISSTPTSIYEEFMGDIQRVVKVSQETERQLIAGKSSLTFMRKSILYAVSLTGLNLILPAMNNVWVALSIALIYFQWHHIKALGDVRNVMHSIEGCEDVTIGIRK